MGKDNTTPGRNSDREKQCDDDAHLDERKISHLVRLDGRKGEKFDDFRL